jgi:uncharacterized protein YndB with AHSA1/START domain
VSARVTADGAGAAGASVTLTVTLPTGKKRTFSAWTDATGLSRFAVRIAKRDPKGIWQAAVTGSAGGGSASAMTTFIVQ